MIASSIYFAFGPHGGIPRVPRRQHGVALFFALVLLLVMTLLGLAIVQVTTLQERMASTYRSQNLAFQGAEAALAEQEAAIAEAVNSGAAFVAQVNDCGNDKDIGQNWADAVTAEEVADGSRQVATKRLDRCGIMPGFSGKKMGQKANEETNAVYQITAAGVDDPDNPTTLTVFDTVYIP